MPPISFVTVGAVLLTVYACPMTADQMADAMNYLMRYGYISDGDANSTVQSLVDKSELIEAVREFQLHAGLPQTGEADEKTLAMMRKPRCGVLDNRKTGTRIKRFALLGQKWKKYILTYRIVKYSRKISQRATDYWLREAFKVWMTVTPLQFYQIYNHKPDIEIIFQDFQHGDPYVFDGKGGTLAHAFAPGDDDIAGDAHFDDSEQWIIRDPNIQGTDLFTVAVHEFGHVLGLSHYYTSGAIMKPFYNYIRDINIVLNYDDINAIQSLYGGNQWRPVPKARVDYVDTTVPTTTTSTTTTARPVPHFCSKPIRFDAIVSTQAGHTYAFSGWQYVYVWNGLHVEPTTPKFTSDVFNQLHWGVDAAFCVKWYDRELIYIIKSWFAWIYEGSNLHLLAAQIPLSTLLPDLPIHLDTAFQWHYDGGIYIFKGAAYWKVQQVQHDVFKAERGYPRSVSDWKLPSGITAAMSWSGDGKTYFFLGSNYYQYADAYKQMAPGFPRPMAVWWLGCPENYRELKENPNPHPQEENNTDAASMATILCHSCSILITISAVLQHIATCNLQLCFEV